MLQRWVPVLLTILALETSVEAGRRIELRRAIEADGTVSVELLAGKIHVSTWGRAEIEITGEVGEDVEDVSLEGSDRHVQIEVELRDARKLSDVEADLAIRLPRGCELEVESVGADVTIEGLSGAVSIESVHGRADVGAGAREVHVASVSGPIVVAGSKELRELAVETVSGSIEFRGPLTKGGEYGFESVSGSIDVEIEGDISASFDVSTFGGKIDSDFGPEPKRESEFLPGTSLSFSEGGGDSEVSIESFSGTIRLRSL